MNTMKAIALDGLSDTIFIKDFSRNNAKLKKIEKELEENKNLDSNTVNKLRKDMYLINQGLYGENSVYFELKNSLLPMLCFHDIKINVGQTCAQIDFLVITNKFMCIMETKNLVGDVTVTEDGDFIREIKYKDGITREGMYSPITQGRRHARILKKALIDAGVIEVNTIPINSIAVMANHKNIIDKKGAPEDISKNIYRCDQIVNFLEKEMNNPEYRMILPDSKIKKIADIIMRLATIGEGPKQDNSNCSSNQSQCENTIIPFNNPCPILPQKTNENIINKDTETNTAKKSNIDNKKESDNNANIFVSLDIEYYQNDKLIRMLKKFRYEKAQENGKEPYEVFTNKEMDLLVSNKPKTINELKKLNLRSWVINDLGFKLLQVINPGEIYQASTGNKNIYKSIETKLKEYRDEIVLKTGLNHYEVFTNADILRLIDANPASIDELFEIKGFNKKDKISKYGKDILNILKA